MTTKTIMLFDDDDEEYTVNAPACWQICSRCKGEGHHSNPAIDGNGITQSEWAEWDPEDREAYMSGRYDIGCGECDGTGKVLEVDDLAFKDQNPVDFRKWRDAEDEDADFRQMADSEARWERRMLYGSDY